MQYQLVTLQKRYAAFLEILKKTPFFAEKRRFLPVFGHFSISKPRKTKNI